MTPRTPSALFGALFAAVQEAGVFPDSKTFADAVPRGEPGAILAAYERKRPSGDALRAFVAEHFDLPADAPTEVVDRKPLAEHVAALWPILTRESVTAPPGSSAIALPHRHVVPGGRFRELYYWDSYFTMLGLRQSGRQDLIDDMIADFGSLIERFGHIPNGTRSYYLSRSHPPVFHLMAALAGDGSTAARAQRLGWLRAEHDFWMAGAAELAPGEEHRRIVRLADGALLNRYWDDADGPREESWREDVALAASLPEGERPRLWRDLRAAAESGWDFSSRWLADRRSLVTVRTTRLVPIDLNCLLLGLEEAIAAEAAALGDDAAAEFRDRAEARRTAIERHLWHEEGGFHADFDLDTGAASDQPTAAMAFALFAGAASPERAARTAGALAGLVAPGGLLVSREHSGQQWDAPNGWAPLQWIAVQGLRRYGEHALADDIRDRWVELVRRHYVATGHLVEKYDVEAGVAGGGGEYEVETGFGWTNGVTVALMAEVAAPVG